MPASPYDQLPYPGLPIARAHPDHIGAIGALLGIDPEPAESCRILEIGCGVGENALSIAASLPGARVVGIDSSAAQIQQALAQAASAGLGNLEFHAIDFQRYQPAEGEKFHYIIAHGVYSWISQPARIALLAACRNWLATNGLAYVSYNTLPGWHMRRTWRDLMLMARDPSASPAEQVAQARAALELLKRTVPQDSHYGRQVAEAWSEIGSLPDGYVFHEYLGGENNPAYFEDFMYSAAQAGLQYVGDAEFFSMFRESLGPAAFEALSGAGAQFGQVRLEQYMDFIRNRTFRATLLALGETVLQPALRPSRLASLSVSALAGPVSGTVDLTNHDNSVFRTPNGSMANATEPLTKAALTYLAGLAPFAASMADLTSEARARVQAATQVPLGDPLVDLANLQAEMLRMYLGEIVELHWCRAPATSRPPEYPTASSLSRTQAVQGDRVTSLFHRSILLDDGHRQVLMACDGTRDHAAIATQLHEKVSAGELKGMIDGEVIDAAESRAHIEELVEQALANLARAGVLRG